MANSEDYLDSLLNSVTKKLSEFDEDFEQKNKQADPYMTKKNLPPKTMKALEEVRENQFLRDFEEELKEEDVDDFLSSFEAELDDEAKEYERIRQEQTKESDEAYFEQVEQLVAESESEPRSSDVDLFDPLTETENFNSDSLTETSFDEIENPANRMSGLDVEETDASEFPDEQEPEIEQLSKEPEIEQLSQEPEIEQLSQEPEMEQTPPDGMDELEKLFSENDIADLTGFDDSDLPKEESSPENLEDGMADLSGDLLNLEDKDEEVILPEDAELDDAGIMELLGGMSEDEALSDIGKMLEADEQDIQLEDISADPENLSLAAGTAKKQSEKPKKKNGLLSGILDLFFGEDEDDEEESVKPERSSSKSVEGIDELESLSDENLEILMTMDSDQLPEPEAEKGKKKRKKKEKKKKEKEPKAKKEKPAKPPKEKKPKPKKEKVKQPKSKPLPRKPVIIIWVLAISIFAFIYFGNSQLSYRTMKSDARVAFDHGNYVLCYEKMAGVKIKAGDAELYEQAKLLAGVQSELLAYHALMDARKYDLALDSLVRGMGRYRLHMAGAEEWGIVVQMESIGREIETQLMDQFHVTKEQAYELYEIDNRDDYSLAIDEILRELGLK